MNQYILFMYNDSLAMTPVGPAYEAEQTALNVVPEGVPYKIVSGEDLPEMKYFAAWEVDFSEPDGVGISMSEYAERYLPQAAPATPAHVPPSPPEIVEE